MSLFAIISSASVIIITALYLFFRHVRKIIKLETEAQNLRESLKNVQEISRDIEQHRNDSIDDVRERMRKFVRES